LTPETGGLALLMKERHKARFDVLSDVDCGVGLNVGVVFRLPKLYRARLDEDYAIAVLPPQHRLLAQSAVTESDVVMETILVGDCCGGFADRLATITSCSLRLQRCNGATSQMLDLVTAGLGIALLSNRLSIGATVGVRPFTDPDLSRRILLTTIPGRPLNPAAASFVKLCRARIFS
jgi:DNA-binding transcriptional LysR family regulator